MRNARNLRFPPSGSPIREARRQRRRQRIYICRSRDRLTREHLRRHEPGRARGTPDSDGAHEPEVDENAPRRYLPNDHDVLRRWIHVNEAADVKVGKPVRDVGGHGEERFQLPPRRPSCERPPMNTRLNQVELPVEGGEIDSLDERWQKTVPSPPAPSSPSSR